MGKTMDKPKTIDLLTFGGEDVKCVRLSDYEELERQLAECQRERDELSRNACQLEPIYQVWQRYEYQQHWDDVDKDEYDSEECADDKRIVYELIDALAKVGADNGVKE